MSSIGSRRSLEHLRSSIVAPNDDVRRRYWVVTLTETGGESSMGFALNEDRHSLQMLELEGRLRSFDKTRLESIDRSKGSLMQSYDGVFEESELDDLHDVLVPTESGVAGLFGRGRDDLDRFADLVPSAALGVGIGAPTARYLLVQGKDDGRPLLEAAGGEGGRYNADSAMLLALGLGSGKAKNAERTEEAAKRMGKLVAAAKEKGNDYQANYLTIMQHELQASAAMVRGQTDAALTHLEKAVGARREARPAVRPCRPDQAVARALR